MILKHNLIIALLCQIKVIYTSNVYINEAQIFGYIYSILNMMKYALCI